MPNSTRIEDNPDLQVKLAKSIPTEKLTVQRLEDRIKIEQQKMTRTVQQPSVSSTIQDPCEIKPDLTALLEKIKAKETAGNCSKCSHLKSCKQISKRAAKIAMELN